MSNPNDHHFAPVAMLRPWQWADKMMRACYWDAYTSEMRCRNDRGAKAYCYASQLFSLSPAQSDPNIIETRFFGFVDDKGIRARDKMLKSGITSLTVEERNHFAHWIMSLQARRPEYVSHLRSFANQIAAELDADADIAAEMQRSGISGSPTSYWVQRFGPLEDRTLLAIQDMVDHPYVGHMMLNSEWHLFSADPKDEAFVLSDRPLIRINAFNSPRAMWAVPLRPDIAFVASSSLADYYWIAHVNH